MAQQAFQGLKWHEGPSSPEKTAAPVGSMQPVERQRPKRAGAGVPSSSLEVGYKFYALCGLSHASTKDFVAGRFHEVEGLLGRGVYCSLDLESARGAGDKREVVLLRFFPGGEKSPPEGFAGIKVTTTPCSTWREEGFAGCWLPTVCSPIGDGQGELCLRADIISKATKYDPGSWGGGQDRSVEVRQSARTLATGIPQIIERWRYQAGLVQWAGLAIAGGAVIVAGTLVRFSFYGSAAAAGCIALMFGLSSL